jgi:hypothetical protein
MNQLEFLIKRGRIFTVIIKTTTIFTNANLKIKFYLFSTAVEGIFDDVDVLKIS